MSSEGDIGPAVAVEPGDLVPVVLSALDRVAMTQEPEYLSVYASTLSWWLLRRLRKLGFVRLLAELGDVLRSRCPGSTATCRRGRRTCFSSPAVHAGPVSMLGVMREAASNLGMKALALAVLLVAAWILFKFVLGVLTALAWVAARDRRGDRRDLGARPPALNARGPLPPVPILERPCTAANTWRS